MGVGATNTTDRVAASQGLLSAVEVDFQLASDVPRGGVLLALPALLAVGLLRHTEKHFALPPGYYGLESLFLLLALMSLARVDSVESLRYCPPGEWGKLLGLDRIPEVRTLRQKLKVLTKDDAPTRWSAELAREWMGDYGASYYYVDGHVRVYTGDKAKLPRHYVSRQKLCLRASADYWVNALGGQPFFVLPQDVDPHLSHVLREEIVPRLLRDAPHQPTEEQLGADALLHRLTVVYDREGYGAQLMLDLKKLRVACLTYNKAPGPDWETREFLPSRVTLVSGEVVDMQLAERGVLLGGKLWVREIRRLMKGGHQTSILSTDYRSGMTVLAPAMFARWCQENYFKYMRSEYNLDRIIQYGVEAIPDKTVVVNPEYRRLDGEVRKKAALLARKRAELQASGIGKIKDPEKLAAMELKMGETLADINRLEPEVADLKTIRRNTPHHIEAGDLPEEQRIDRLVRQSKHFIDTIKMIAYRAETAMAVTLRENRLATRMEEIRALLRSVFESEADLIPDETQQTLTVRVHYPANPSAARVMGQLCQELNLTETRFPGTDLQMVFQLVAPHNPRGQEV